MKHFNCHYDRVAPVFDAYFRKLSVAVIYTDYSSLTYGVVYNVWPYAKPVYCVTFSARLLIQPLTTAISDIDVMDPYFKSPLHMKDRDHRGTHYIYI